MNVIKIVVDEIPEYGCDDCTIKRPSVSRGGYDIIICSASCKDVTEHTENATRPSWCPLVVEDVCEWHETEVNEHGWRFWMTGCKIKYDSSVQITKGEFNFCPSCGKRIKYVEVE